MLINLKNIQKTYITKTGVSFRALSNVSLSFDQSGLVFLVGKSGSGKTTLLNLIGGLDGVDSGTIYVGGKNLSRLSNREIDSYRNTMVGFVFQEFNLIDYMTVFDNVSLALDMQSDKDAAKVEAALAQVDLTDKKNEKVKNLSGGQKQRVGIARAIVKNPSIILADEPTGALDYATGEDVMNIFRRLAKDRLVIIVSHDMEKAVQYADRIVEMKDGTIYRDVRRKKEGEVIDYSNIQITSNTLIRLEKGVTLGEKDAEKITEIIAQKGRKAYVNVDANPQKIKALFPNLREAVDSRPQKTDIPDKTVNDDIPSDNNSTDNKSNINKSNNNPTTEVKADLSGSDSFVPYRPIESEQKSVSFKKSKLSSLRALKMGASNLNLKKGRMIFTIIIAVIALILFGASVSFAGYDLNAAYMSSIKQDNYHSIIATNSAGTNYRIKESDLAELQKDNPRISAFSQYNLELYPYIASHGSPLYFNSIIETDDALSLKLSMLTGSSMLNSHTDVVVSQAMAREILRREIMPGANDYGDLIGKKIQLYSPAFGTDPCDYTVVGIFKSDLEKYKNDRDDMRLYTDLHNYIEGVLIVKTGFRQAFVQGKVQRSLHINLTHSSSSDTYNTWCTLLPSTPEICKTYGIRVDYLNGDGEIEFDNIVLKNNEFLLSRTILGSFDLKYPTYDDEQITDDDIEVFWSGGNGTYPIADFNADLNKTICFSFNSGFGDNSMYFSDDVIIKGVISGNDGNDYVAVASKELVEKLAIEQMYVNRVMLVLSGSNKANSSLIKYLSNNGFAVESEFANAYNNLRGVVSTLYKVIIGFSLVLCLLVVVMMFTFISSSIKITKKQIGILRALGARKIDTFKVYALEGAVIGLIAFAVATAALLIFSPIINLIVSARMGFYFAMLNIGFKDIMAILALMASVTAVSVLIPIRKFNKITPIKAIVEKE